MKTKMLIQSLVVAAATLAAGNARAGQAADTTIATFGVYLGIEDGNVASAQVSLADDGHLTIVKTVRGQPAVTSTVQTTVAPSTLTLLKTKIEQLSTVEIKTTQSQLVCMMMPLWGGTSRVLTVRRGYDFNTDSFTGELATIDNNAGCWSRTHIVPAPAYGVETAKELESQLEVLTSEAVANQ